MYISGLRGRNLGGSRGRAAVFAGEELTRQMRGQHLLECGRQRLFPAFPAAVPVLARAMDQNLTVRTEYDLVAGRRQERGQLVGVGERRHAVRAIP
jgi:hypothetical protein